MDNTQLLIKQHLHFLGPELLEEVFRFGIIKDIPAETVILSEGQYVRVIPVVLDGLIKVYGSYEEKVLLLYYIEPFQSCIICITKWISASWITCWKRKG